MSPGDTVTIDSDTTRLTRWQARYAGQTGTVVSVGLTTARVRFANGSMLNFQFASLETV